MRKKFLIKPLLQIRHLIWTLSIIFVGLVTCYVVFEAMVENAVISGPLTLEQWIAMREQLRMGFGLTTLILLFAVGFENYLFFHRVVGPIYALEKGLRRLTQGDYHDETHIREYDELKEVIKAFEDMKRQIVSKIELQERTALLLASELDQILVNTSPDNIKHLKTKLKEIREQVERKAA